MSDHDEHSSVIKTPKQLIVVVLAAFIVPITVIALLTQFVTGGISTGKDDPAMSEQAVAKRLKPVGELALAGSSPAAAATVTAATPATATAPTPTPTPTPTPVSVSVAGGAKKAKSIYDASCAACHGSGVAGAPKLGDKQAWAPRIKAGNATLYNGALKGKNAMPAKGGNPALSDADVKAVVDYMVSQSK